MYKVKKREGFIGQKMVVIPQNVRQTLQQNPLINTLYITDIGYYPFAEHHYREREIGADEYILIYCLKGHGWIELDHERHDLVPNSYFIIPKNTKHRYGAREEDPWTIYWLHFTGQHAHQLFKKYELRDSVDQNPSAIQIPFEERRINFFTGLISLLESGYSNEIVEYVNISLWQLIASFIYSGYFSEIRHQNYVTDLVDTAIKYMRNNMERSISVDELAIHLNYSSSYLYSLFKKETGYSPIHYFNHLKIQKSCQYLSFTHMSIKEISYKLGFNDPFYFSRLFKKLMEISPTEYRNKL